MITDETTPLMKNKVKIQSPEVQVKKSPETSPWEEEHLDVSDGGLRAAVFGFNDGLVTNLCLVTGLHIASPEAPVLVTGVAGLLAGAVSMCIGEWLSMTAQAEALEHELLVEERHLREFPDQEEEHLTEILRDHGITEETLQLFQRDIRVADMQKRVHLHARLELGIDPEELGSPIKAAVFSFISFSVGAFVPLIPWLIWANKALCFNMTLIFAAVASLIVGGLFSLKSPRSAFTNASRQIIVCALATGFCLLCNYFLDANSWGS